MARNGRFSRKCTCKPFWPRDLRLVVLCIKLWSVHGGGTVRVSKFIIVSSVWSSNYQLQRHLNGLKKARTWTLGSKNQWKRQQMSSTRSMSTYGMLQKKIDPSAENRVLQPTKMASNERFHENTAPNPSGQETYPWCCYPLNDGRYVEEGPSEWRKASFWLLFGKIILGCKGT
jgi:hypothetical protein